MPSWEFTTAGVPLIKNGDTLSQGFADPRAACVSGKYHRQNGTYAAVEGMEGVCLDGEIRAQFSLGELPAHVNQRVAMLSASSIRPELLTAWLNHPCVQEQLLQWSVQTTVEHISNRIVGDALMLASGNPKKSSLPTQFCGRGPQFGSHGSSSQPPDSSSKPSSSARSTEADLVTAHKDRAADRTLLERLSVGGFDVADADPLFPDLDRLEELLREARQGDEA